MALPSQTARITLSGRTYGMRRRRRSNKPLFVAIGALVALVVLIWWVIRPFGATGEDTQVAQGSGEGEPTLLASATPNPEPPPKPIVEIGQGRLSSAPAPDPGPGTSLASAQDSTASPVAPLASTLKTPEETQASPESTRISEPLRSNALVPSNLPADLGRALTAGRQLLAAGDLVGARSALSRVLADPRTSESERQSLRGELARISDELVFSPRVAAADPFTTMYTVVKNDGLERISRKTGSAGHWRLIQRVNRLSDPRGIREGQTLKIVKGPFHALVSKSAFRMDVYMGDPGKPADWVYVRSFPVGLGADNGTPTGTFVVKTNSKLENPYWVNPRTGEQFHKDDPKNPIGERWIGLQGQGEAAAVVGIGIHGTIEPDSIGKERSMGCIRLGVEEVELVYDLLSEGVSVVEIRP